MYGKEAKMRVMTCDGRDTLMLVLHTKRKTAHEINGLPRLKGTFMYTVFHGKSIQNLEKL